MIIISRPRQFGGNVYDWGKHLAVRCETTVVSVPFLYDLRAVGPTVQRLQAIDEPILLFSTLSERAAYWLLKKLDIGKHEWVCVETDFTDDWTPNSETQHLIHTSSEPGVEHLDEMTVKRWYPVIDRDACVNCLECVNYCLFGVYVIGPDDSPLVDQPDACRDGCPACARVCPQAAIMFPLHNDPDISGRTSAEAARQRMTPSNSVADQERYLHTVQTSDTKLDKLVEQIDDLDW